ncbi:DUF7139 domain-containing protein [Salinilacihabitans rarus]|uniref:DUF7139 domain-containing protein n=1 Tax=Salinilacihabitans rarus TaxID=2961596 RepID=UPI0020C8DF94|nr:hypothetical protein [Salinilacihabitans rarus]
MTSLTEVYEGNAGEVSSLRRLYAGTALVIAGAVLAVVAVLVATTDLLAWAFEGPFAPVKWAGIAAGVGVPTALVGVFVVLPSSRRVKAAAAIGLALCLLGVALFWHAYPSHWRGHGDNLTWLVSAVYLLGLFTAVWCLFTAVVNFKTRNDPGGMLEMNVTRTNETKVVEVEHSGGVGGVGFLGDDPDGEVATQTNGPVAAAASDGGAAAGDIRSPLDDDGAEVVSGSGSPAETTDRYCGNCQHFRYVRTADGMTPYCDHYEGAMDDMDACGEWTPNHERG